MTLVRFSSDSVALIIVFLLKKSQVWAFHAGESKELCHSRSWRIQRIMPLSQLENPKNYATLAGCKIHRRKKKPGATQHMSVQSNRSSRSLRMVTWLENILRGIRTESNSRLPIFRLFHCLKKKPRITHGYVCSHVLAAMESFQNYRQDHFLQSKRN